MRRRRFLGAALAAGTGLLLPVALRAAGARRGRGDPDGHPTPRPGITGDKVLTADQLAKRPQLIPLFAAVSAAAGVIDGIRCNCGCARETGYYSLLSCFEAPAMARDCVICQGQARLATRLNGEGKTLDEIRAAVDAKFQ